MVVLTIELNAEGRWTDIEEAEREGKFIDGRAGRLSIGGLPAGTQSGKPTVAFKLALPDGRVLFTETTLALFLTAADALKARYGDPRGS